MCFNKCLWYPAKAGQSVARARPRLAARGPGGGQRRAPAWLGAARGRLGISVQASARRLCSKRRERGCPAFLSSRIPFWRGLVLGRADPGLLSNPNPSGAVLISLLSKVRGEAEPGSGEPRGSYFEETLEVTGLRPQSLK